MIEASLRQILLSNEQNTEAYYKAIRQRGGADGFFWDGELAGWVVTSYHLSKYVLESDAFSKERLNLNRSEFPQAWDKFLTKAQLVVNHQMMFDDSAAAGAAHAAWRAELRSKNSGMSDSELYNLATEMLRRTEDRSSANLYVDVLRPFVSKTVSSKLGIPESERLNWVPLIYKYANFLDSKIRNQRDIGEAILSILALANMVTANFESIRHIAVVAGHDKQRWTADYILNLVAGHESTAYALGIALLYGGQVGGAFASDASRQQCILEALRFDSPIQMVGRVATSDVFLERHGFIRSGDKVFVHVGAANRDPGAFSEPNNFSFGRKRVNLLSFGAGRSKCIGISFTINQATQFLKAVHRAFGDRKIKFGATEYAHGLAGRSFERLSLI